MLLPKCIILLKTLMFLLLVKSQEVTTPSNLLPPRNFNHHPFDAVQFLKSLKAAEPTKQGPVLFPNDAPPPPRPPLIVTSRPLTESIARSELNNTLTSQSQVHGFLARIKDYRPFAPTPSFDYNLQPSRIPYADVVKKNRFQTLDGDNRYNDYEERTILPPIYKALADHAQQKVLKINDKNKFYYQVNQPEYNSKYQNNEINDDGSADYDHNKNYAFSYTVKDQKTGDDFSHSQHSRGSATNGEYRVRLPDGRMQIVSYTADENGYKADVRYDEEKTARNDIENDYAHNYSPKNYAYNDYNEEKTARNDIENDYVHNYDLKNYEQNVFPNNNYASNRNIDYSKQSTDYIDVSNNKNKYPEKIKPVDEKDDYYYPDNSREFYNDYSSEYNINNQPYKSKFAAFAPTKTTSATVTPNYEQLKELLVTKDAYKTEQNYDRIDLNVPSSTPSPYEGTTEHVVVITKKTPNLYTNIGNSLTVGTVPNYNNPIASYNAKISPIGSYNAKINPIASYNANINPTASYTANINPTASYNANISPRVILATTPRSYLVSTIASIKNKIHLSNKPILSDSYVNKINKYLTFN